MNTRAYGLTVLNCDQIVDLSIVANDDVFIRLSEELVRAKAAYNNIIVLVAEGLIVAAGVCGIGRKEVDRLKDRRDRLQDTLIVVHQPVIRDQNVIVADRCVFLKVGVSEHISIHPAPELVTIAPCQKDIVATIAGQLICARSRTNHSLDQVALAIKEAHFARITDQNVVICRDRHFVVWTNGCRIKIAKERVIAVATDPDVVAFSSDHIVIAVRVLNDAIDQIECSVAGVFPVKWTNRQANVTDQAVITNNGVACTAHETRGCCQIVEPEIRDQAIIAEGNVVASAAIDVVIISAAENKIRSGFAKNGVVVFITKDDVRTASAFDVIVAFVAADKVVVVSAKDFICAVVVQIEHIWPGYGGDFAVAIDDIVLIPARKAILASTTCDVVKAGFSKDGVVAQTAVDNVVGTATVNQVCATMCINNVRCIVQIVG